MTQTTERFTRQPLFDGSIPPARKGLTPHHRALLRRAIVHDVAIAILAEQGKLDSWTEDEYLAAIRLAQARTRLDVEGRAAMSERLIDDAARRALVERGEEVTAASYEAELHAQADDSPKVTEIRYRAAAAAVEELGQAMLAEEGVTDPTEAQLADIYARAAKMLAVEVQ